MNCLHLCNDFLGSKVHRNLYDKLHELGVRQTVFVPLRTSTKKRIQSFETKNLRLIYSKPLYLYHRILFRRKIKHLFKSLERQISIKDFDIIAASTLFSDGYLAYKLHKKYALPYIVVVRSTDVDVFMLYRPDLTRIMVTILSSAAKIIFVSDSLKDKFIKRLGERHHRLLEKSHVLYNGVDPFWLTNLYFEKRSCPVKLLYVGSLIKRKNILKVIKSVLRLNRIGIEVQLNIVGDKGAYKQKVIRFALEHSGVINYLGQIHDKEKLKAIYRENHIFIMPSFRETFGLVYIEALSQGLPVIVAKSEGIDGVLDEVVLAVDPCSLNSISDGLITLIRKYNNIRFDHVDFQLFNWDIIAERYLELFNHSINSC